MYSLLLYKYFFQVAGAMQSSGLDDVQRWAADQSITGNNIHCRDSNDHPHTCGGAEKNKQTTTPNTNHLLGPERGSFWHQPLCHSGFI